MRYRERVENCLESLDVIKNQKIIAKMSLADQLRAINQLNIDQLEDKRFKDDIDSNVKESDFLPKLIMKNESKFKTNV
jgi:hypothetical protein